MYLLSQIALKILKILFNFIELVPTDYGEEPFL